MAAQYEVAGRTYVIGRLNVRQQFDLTVRLGVMNLYLERELTDTHVDGARLLAGAFSGDLATMPQADRDWIVGTCLSVVRTIRDPAARPVPVMNASGLPQFDSEDDPFEMTTMLELVDLVIQENLGPFYEKLRRERETQREDLADPPPSTNQ